jgi:hypothetical protein
MSRCRGTTKWVHQACIQRWVDEKQKGNNSADVECPQCGTTYVIKFPKANLVVAMLDAIDKLIQRLCPVSQRYHPLSFAPRLTQGIFLSRLLPGPFASALFTGQA